MEIKLTNKTITLPDVIYLDQLLQLDLSIINEMDILSKSNNITDMGKILKFFLDFFKVLGIKERFTITDFKDLQKDNQLMNWFQGLMQGFQASS